MERYQTAVLTSMFSPTVDIEQLSSNPDLYSLITDSVLRSSVWFLQSSITRFPLHTHKHTHSIWFHSESSETRNPTPWWQYWSLGSSCTWPGRRSQTSLLTRRMSTSSFQTLQSTSEGVTSFSLLQHQQRRQAGGGGGGNVRATGWRRERTRQQERKTEIRMKTEGFLWRDEGK